MSNFDFNVPLPKKGNEKYFADFENFPLNASKFFALDKGKRAENKRVYIYGKCKEKNKGAKFETRMVTENGIEGIRIWRVL